MTNGALIVSPKDEKTILTLFAASRRAFSRQLDDDDVLAAAFSWTGWHATAAYKIKAPLARCAVVLGIDAAAAAAFISAYNTTEACEPEKCDRAKADFVDLYRQLSGDDLSEFKR